MRRRWIWIAFASVPVMLLANRPPKSPGSSPLEVRALLVRARYDNDRFTIPLVMVNRADKPIVFAPYFEGDAIVSLPSGKEIYLRKRTYEKVAWQDQFRVMKPGSAVQNEFQWFLEMRDVRQPMIVYVRLQYQRPAQPVRLKSVDFLPVIEAESKTIKLRLSPGVVEVL